MDGRQMASLAPALMDLLETFRNCFHEPTFRHFRTYVLGLLDDLPRKNVEAIALAANVPVRTLQEFLSQLRWDHDRLHELYQHLVADRHACEQAIGVIDTTGHPKQGTKTPGVQRQYCGQTGKIDNCVLGVHLLYTDNDPHNPFSCMLDSELYVPRSWLGDPARCREAGIPSGRAYQPEWEIAVDLVAEALCNGIRFSWMTFDESYGKVPAFGFALDALGLRWVGEVPRNFRCWPTPPRYHSYQGPFASKYVQNVVRHSPAFTRQSWQKIKIKDTTRGACIWRVKAARVQLPNRADNGPTRPTDRRYWLLVTVEPRTGEIKYFLSNAPANAKLVEILRAAFARWHVEKWFERAKQLAGFGSFEVRRHVGLMRHWLCSRIAMYFLACQTRRLRGEKSADHPRAGGPRGDAIADKGRQLLAKDVA
jgi:SRSO17 transposase